MFPMITLCELMCLRVFVVWTFTSETQRLAEKGALSLGNSGVSYF
jgi:hypothetical protein